MIFNKYFLIGALISLGFLGFVGFEIWQKLPNGNIQVVFLQETRGDAIYIKSPHGKEILIDGGIDRGILTSLQKYRPFWDRYIDVIIITHPDADHYYGALEVIKRFEVGKIFLNGVMKNDPKYEELFQLAQQKKIEIIFASAQSDFVLDSVQIDFIYPFTSLLGTLERGGNNDALVFFLKYKDKKIFFTADMEIPVEQQLLQSGVDLQSDILKVPHHGSKSSSSLSLLQAVHPTRAIVQVGTQNPFGHPHTPVVERYKKSSIPFESTKSGDIVVEW